MDKIKEILKELNSEELSNIPFLVTEFATKESLLRDFVDVLEKSYSSVLRRIEIRFIDEADVSIYAKANKKGVMWEWEWEK